MNAPGGSLYNSLLVEDTIIISGTAVNQTSTQRGIYFAKIDTLGNVLTETVYFDENGDNLAQEDGYEMIKTEDGGYAIVGVAFLRTNPFLLKLDVNGNAEWYAEFDDIGPSTIRHRKVFEHNSVFYTSGVEQEPTGVWNNAFILAIDQDGNLLWDFEYGETDLFESFADFEITETGNIICYGGRSSGAYQGISFGDLLHPADAWRQDLTVEINTSGELINSYTGTSYLVADSISGIGSSIQTDDFGNRHYVGVAFKLIDIDGDPYFFNTSTITKTDAEFNPIWRTRIGEQAGYRNIMYDLTEAQDGGWIGAGRYFVHPVEQSNMKGHYTGHLAKVTVNGELQWERTDTLFYGASYEEDEITQYFNSVFTLPSGSIIATGRIDNYEVSPPRSYGWMIKLDPDGCLTPGCHPNLTGINITEQMQNIEVFPNPTSQYVTVRAKEKFTTEVYDAFGKRVLGEENHYEEGQLDLSNLAAGIYFINVRSGVHFIYTKKVVKQ